MSPSSWECRLRNDRPPLNRRTGEPQPKPTSKRSSIPISRPIAPTGQHDLAVHRTLIVSATNQRGSHGMALCGHPKEQQADT